MESFTNVEATGYVGKTIGEICGNKFDTTTQNHCAHFVSHALGIKLATLCGDLKFATKGTGATIRCNELFNSLPQRGKWSDRPQGSFSLLIFIISASSVPGNVMQDVPQKHVGIYQDGRVYNYSNNHRKVVCDLSTDIFYNRINSVYSADDVSLFYGVPP